MRTKFRENTNFLFLDYETTGLIFDINNPNTDYPIEIGGILTDSNLTMLTTFESLIATQPVYDRISNAAGEWPAEYYTAYKVHKIDPAELIQYGAPIDDVVTDISNIVDKYKKDLHTKTIIVSDNAQFEFNITKFMFDLTKKKFPFHFTAWDTSMLLESSGVKDPKPVHRAFGDVSLVYQAVIRAMERTGAFNG